MKAVVLTAYGAVDKLELRDVPDGKPGAREIKVRVAGASINPVDWKLRSGSLREMMPLQFPTILGRDAAGLVVEVGSAVKEFKVGDRVMGLVEGGYAEFVVASAEAWAIVPAHMDLVDAGALPLVLLTGAQLVEDAVSPNRGDVVLVTGATGSVGRAAVFAAKALGAKVWAGVRSAQKGDAAKLGADGVVALDSAAELATLPPLSSIADTIGGDTLASLLPKVKRGGTIGSVVGEPVGAKDCGLTVRTMMARPDAKRLGELAVAVAEGKLIIPIARRLPLARAREAQAFAAKGAGGKVVLTMTV